MPATIAAIDGNSVPINFKCTVDGDGSYIPHHTADVKTLSSEVAYLGFDALVQDVNVYAGPCRLKSLAVWGTVLGTDRHGLAVHVFDLATVAGTGSTQKLVLFASGGDAFRQLKLDGMVFADGITIRITEQSDGADNTVPHADDYGVIVEYEPTP